MLGSKCALRLFSSKIKDLGNGPGLKDFLKQSHPAGTTQLDSLGESEMNFPANHLFNVSKTNENKRFYIETYGCQMNVSDSEIVTAILQGAGYSICNSAEEADYIFANTCSIRENAEAKVWNRLDYFNFLKKEAKKKRKNPPKVGVLGCMAERLKTKLIEESTVDLVAGPDAYRDLPRLLDVVDAQGSAVNVQLSLEETYADINPVRIGTDNISAFVSIMRGCNNMCSFCIVPFTRGRERSRPVPSIVDEIKYLRDSGVKEVVLLGQNVNSYHDKSLESVNILPTNTYKTADGFTNRFNARNGGGYRFANLLQKVAEIDPEIRIRFTSPHPKDFPDDLLTLVSETPNICKQLHLPAQSGSTKVLEKMKRGYTREVYLNLAYKARTIIPNVALSTDIIAGFCGEIDEDHDMTVSLMNEVKFEQAFMFAYSRRERTHAAYHFEDDVPPDVKQKRLQEIIDTYHHNLFEILPKEIGNIHLVLIDGLSKKSTIENPSWTGRTDTNKRCVFDEIPIPGDINSFLLGDQTNMVRVKPGDYVAVEIIRASGITLFARPLARTTMTEYNTRISQPFGPIVFSNLITQHSNSNFDSIKY